VKELAIDSAESPLTGGRWGVFLGNDTGTMVLLGEGITRPIALELASRLLLDLKGLVDQLHEEIG
jgi:hypothetical protein